MNIVVKRIIVALVIAAIAILALFVAGSMITFHLLMRTPQHTIQEVNWLPPHAQVLFFSDSHGGFHGDGETYLAFTALPVDIDRLLGDLSDSHGVSWTTNTLDEAALRTIDCVCRNLKVPGQVRPEIRDTYLVAHSPVFDGIYYTLIVVNREKTRCWYIRVTN